MFGGDLYNLLGVQREASNSEIRAAYHQAARRFHPDANSNPGAAEEFKLIADAYAVLSDADRRAAYDASLENSAAPLLTVRATFSRSPLPVLTEPQVLYALIGIEPAIADDLPTPPVNLCLVVDRSTSMQGQRLDQVKAAAMAVIDSLRDVDSFSVIAFSDKAEVVVPAQRGTAEKTLAKARVSTISAGGGTEILQGVLCGLTELHRNLSSSAINHLLLLTDGRTYGDEEDCLLLASLAASDGIVVSALGIGDEWNDRFVDELAGRTGGTVGYISSLDNVAAFIGEHVHRLGNVYAERVTIQAMLDARTQLATVFKVQPEAGPVPDNQPLRLGTLFKRKPAAILFKFVLPPLPAGDHCIARLVITSDVVSVGRRGERVTLDLALPAVINTPPPAPPPALVEALSRLSQYQMQERAWQQAAQGDLEGAVTRLRTLGTRLMAGGQPELARLTLNEAARLERTSLLSEEAKKQIKYGTRALISGPAPRRQPQ
jgi:Ca-activated chloride channel homolog